MKTVRRRVVKCAPLQSERCTFVYLDGKEILQKLTRKIWLALELECGHKREMTLAQAQNVTPKEANCKECAT